MPITFYVAAASICRCDHKAPPARVLRSTVFNTELARFIVDLGLSGGGTEDWVRNELFKHGTGALISASEKKIAIRCNPTLTDELFGVDSARTFNRYRERAFRPFRYRLNTRLVRPVTVMHFAREIHLCRTAGVCSRC